VSIRYMTISRKNEGKRRSPTKNDATSPKAGIAKRQRRRKYYTIRPLSLQAIPAQKKKGRFIMRESMLHNLYFGEINPWERAPVRTREYKEITGKIAGIEAHLKSLLSPEDCDKFEEMQNLQARADAIDSTDLFAYAFRTGALMMIDIFGYEGTD